MEEGSMMERRGIDPRVRLQFEIIEVRRRELRLKRDLLLMEEGIRLGCDVERWTYDRETAEFVEKEGSGDSSGDQATIS
jgi:hypothetical protein